MLCTFETIGLCRRDYGLHSLRFGGASAAANAQVTDRLFRRHSRWKSDKAKELHYKDNILYFLSVVFVVFVIGYLIYFPVFFLVRFVYGSC